MSTAVAEPQAPEAAAPEAPQITPETISNLSPEQRDAALFGAPAAQAETKEEPKAEPEVAKPEVKPETASAEPEPPKEEAKPEIEVKEEPEEDGITKNFRLHTDDPKTSAFFKAFKAAQRVNPSVNPIDVAKLVGYDLPGTEAKAPEPEGPSEIELMEQEAKSFADEAARLSGEIDQLDEDTPASTVAKLMRQHGEAQKKHGELTGDIKVAKLKAELSEARQSERSQEQRLEARNATKTEVLKDWPTANDDDSLLGAEVSRLYSEMKADPNHADHTELAKDTGPKWLVEKAVKAMTSRLVKQLGYTEEQAVAAIKGKPVAEAKGPAEVPQAAKTAVPRTAPMAVAGIRPAPEAQPTLDINKIRERAKNDPAFRDKALFGDTSTWVVR